MSYIRKGILGAAVISVSFAAAQFALGEDLTVGMRTAGIPDQAVDRSAKTDRAPILAEPVAPTQTISIHVDRVPDTSVLVRIPVAAHEDQGSTDKPGADQGTAVNQDSANQGSAPQGNAAPAAQQVREPHKGPLASCEPVVSVLTDIAKRLQPGRCIT
jgi:hypothetical protein